MNAGSRENADSRDSGAVQKIPLPAAASAKPRSFWNKLTALFAKGTLGVQLRSGWEKTRTSIVLKHLLIASESQDEYIRSYLRNGENANSLKTEPDAKWQTQLDYFDAELAEIAGLAKNARVPLVAAFVPNRPQAAMISKGNWPTGYDPFKLDNEARDIILSHGGHFIDILPGYRAVPSPERDYFAVDGHPDADAQAIIARLLAKELTNGAVPELKSSTPRDIAMEPGK